MSCYERGVCFCLYIKTCICTCLFVLYYVLVVLSLHSVQEGTVSVVTGGQDGSLRFCAFAVGQSDANFSQLLLQQLLLQQCIDLPGRSQQVPQTECNESCVTSPPLSAVALHHEAPNIVAAGSELGSVVVASFGVSAGATPPLPSIDSKRRVSSEALWSAAAPLGVPILAAQVSAIVMCSGFILLRPPSPPC